MRKYINVIFDTNGKQRSAQHLVDDVVELFKAWESGKNSNKLNFIFESKEAGRVSKSLIKMFGLNKLKGYSDISSLKDARWAVLHVYSKEKGYPLWSLKYTKDCTGKMKELIDNLMKVVTDPESMKDSQLLEATINGYDLLKTDFGNLLLPQENNFQKGFVTYIKGIEIVDLKDEEVEAATKYLHEHLESEVGMWTEEEVKDKLKDWRMTTIQPVTPPTNPGMPIPPTTIPGMPPTQPVPVISPDDLKKKRNKAINRVNNSEDLRQAIENMINAEDSNVIDILLKYV